MRSVVSGDAAFSKFSFLSILYLVPILKFSVPSYSVGEVTGVTTEFQDGFLEQSVKFRKAATIAHNERIDQLEDFRKQCLTQQN